MSPPAAGGAGAGSASVADPPTNKAAAASAPWIRVCLKVMMHPHFMSSELKHFSRPQSKRRVRPQAVRHQAWRSPGDTAGTELSDAYAVLMPIKVLRPEV